MAKLDNVKTSSLIPYERNARKNDNAVSEVAKSIQRTGYRTPIIVDENMVVLAGHTRLKAIKKLGWTEIPFIIQYTDLDEKQKQEYRIRDNKTGELAEWDFDILEADFSSDELLDFGFDIKDLTQPEVEEDEAPPVPEIPRTVKGDIYTLGQHRVMCGDSTIITDVEKLMNGKKADMGFNDPPYGMKKENVGVIGDNLNYDDLLEFNRKWIICQFSTIKENGSFYCWGTDEPLMDIYSEIIKPFIKDNKATFRNLITWDKGNGQGQNSEKTRSYAIADEKCLFIMMGVQGFNNNSDNYFEGWEPVRGYLLKSRLAMGWDVPTMKRIVGHSSLSTDHWTSKSQFNFPTREVYQRMKDEADKLRAQTGNDAFKKEYDEFKKEYDAIKKEYDEFKKEYYGTRAFFDNTHDNFNNVWKFKRHLSDGSEGKHATPKPIELCARAIKSSSPINGLVMDLFLGSGSTLIACEQTNRICYGIELAEKYCDVIVQRWVNLTGGKVILNGEEIEWAKTS